MRGCAPEERVVCRSTESLNIIVRTYSFLRRIWYRTRHHLPEGPRFCVSCSLCHIGCVGRSVSVLATAAIAPSSQLMGVMIHAALFPTCPKVRAGFAPGAEPAQAATRNRIRRRAGGLGCVLNHSNYDGECSREDRHLAVDTVQQ